MTRKTILAALLTLVATLGTLFAAPTPGMAAEADFYDECAKASVSCQYGVSVSSAPATPCGSYHKNHDVSQALIAKVCVAASGDYVYVYDGYADGHMGLGRIESSAGVDFRLCANTQGTHTWVRCNFDWSESATKTVSVGVRVSYTKITVFERFELRVG